MNNSGSGLRGNHFGTALGLANKLQRARSGLAQFLVHTRCKPLLLITAACLIVQEQYPLSHFPMYSSFGPNTFYLYLADGTGDAIGSFASVGISTATLKKIFSTEMRKESERLRIRTKELSLEQKKAVGERLLFTLKNSPAARQRGGVPPNGLRLYEVDIALREGRFEKETILIAEIP